MVPEPQAEGKIVGYISESMSEDEAERGSFRVFKVQSSIVLGLPSGDCTFLGRQQRGCRIRIVLATGTCMVYTVPVLGGRQQGWQWTYSLAAPGLATSISSSR